MKNKILVIGKIVSHHGIRGELKIYPYVDDASVFLDFDHLLVGEEALELEGARLHKNMVLAQFKDIDSIEKGEHLLNREVSIEREFLDDGGGYFTADLVGLEARSESGEVYGTIVDVMSNSVHDLYEIEMPGGKTFLVPVVDEFVRSIDIDGGYVVLSLIDGMVELAK